MGTIPQLSEPRSFSPGHDRSLASCHRLWGGDRHFFGFTPLWSLKTLLSIAVAWLLGGNKIAAAISVQLHDLILPFMPAIYLWEYKLGFWVLNGHLPERFTIHHLSFRDYIQWETFFTVGRPLLIGSVIIGLPSAVLVYFVTKALVTSHRAHKAKPG